MLALAHMCMHIRWAHQLSALFPSDTRPLSARPCSHTPPSLRLSFLLRAMATGLTVDGQPIQGLDGAVGDTIVADALYKRLEDTYKWGPDITKYLREVLILETIHDFLSAFKSEKSWDDFYDADIKQTSDSKPVPRGLRSRVSQAYTKVKAAQQSAADLRSKGEEVMDFDKPLKSDDIKKKVQAFWDRHKLMLVLSKMPGDMLISRIAKELEKRFLHITDLSASRASSRSAVPARRARRSETISIPRSLPTRWTRFTPRR